MFKRVTWLTVGFGLGVGTTVAAAREVRKRVDRYQPNAIVDRASDGLGRLRDQLADAVETGRVAARAREVELRAVRTPDEPPT
ncbi:MAG TPA: hypothetical protein VHS03_10075 [Gaiellaceae bacterium]|jgi:hypothetical protein|nr:hypothetical protein [Gaiellaceae bacterium]